MADPASTVSPLLFDCTPSNVCLVHSLSICLCLSGWVVAFKSDSVYHQLPVTFSLSLMTSQLVSLVDSRVSNN